MEEPQVFDIFDDSNGYSEFLSNCNVYHHRESNELATTAGISPPTVCTSFSNSNKSVSAWSFNSADPGSDNNIIRNGLPAVGTNDFMDQFESFLESYENDRQQISANSFAQSSTATSCAPESAASGFSKPSLDLFGTGTITPPPSSSPVRSGTPLIPNNVVTAPSCFNVTAAPTLVPPQTFDHGKKNILTTSTGDSYAVSGRQNPDDLNYSGALPYSSVSGCTSQEPISPTVHASSARTPLERAERASAGFSVPPHASTPPGPAVVQSIEPCGNDKKVLTKPDLKDINTNNGRNGGNDVEIIDVKKPGQEQSCINNNNKRSNNKNSNAKKSQKKSKTASTAAPPIARAAGLKGSTAPPALPGAKTKNRTTDLDATIAAVTASDGPSSGAQAKTSYCSGETIGTTVTTMTTGGGLATPMPAQTQSPAPVIWGTMNTANGPVLVPVTFVNGQPVIQAQVIQTPNGPVAVALANSINNLPSSANSSSSFGNSSSTLIIPATNHVPLNSKQPTTIANQKTEPKSANLSKSSKGLSRVKSMTTYKPIRPASPHLFTSSTAVPAVTTASSFRQQSSGVMLPSSSNGGATPSTMVPSMCIAQQRPQSQQYSVVQLPNGQTGIFIPAAQQPNNAASSSGFPPSQAAPPPPPPAPPQMPLVNAGQGSNNATATQSEPVRQIVMTADAYAEFEMLTQRLRQLQTAVTAGDNNAPLLRQLSEQIEEQRRCIVRRAISEQLLPKMAITGVSKPVTANNSVSETVASSPLAALMSYTSSQTQLSNHDNTKSQGAAAYGSGLSNQHSTFSVLNNSSVCNSSVGSSFGSQLDLVTQAMCSNRPKQFSACVPKNSFRDAVTEITKSNKTSATRLRAMLARDRVALQQREASAQPLHSVDEAISHLLPYHLYADSDVQTSYLEEVDSEFRTFMLKCQSHTQTILRKFQTTLMKDALRLEATSELVLLTRLAKQSEEDYVERLPPSLSPLSPDTSSSQKDLKIIPENSEHVDVQCASPPQGHSLVKSYDEELPLCQDSDLLLTLPTDDFTSSAKLKLDCSGSPVTQTDRRADQQETQTDRQQVPSIKLQLRNGQAILKPTDVYESQNCRPSPVVVPPESPPPLSCSPFPVLSPVPRLTIKIARATVVNNTILKNSPRSNDNNDDNTAVDDVDIDSACEKPNTSTSTAPVLGSLSSVTSCVRLSSVNAKTEMDRKTLQQNSDGHHEEHELKTVSENICVARNSNNMEKKSPDADGLRLQPSCTKQEKLILKLKINAAVEPMELSVKQQCFTSTAVQQQRTVKTGVSSDSVSDNVSVPNPVTTTANQLNNGFHTHFLHSDAKKVLFLSPTEKIRLPPNPDTDTSIVSPPKSFVVSNNKDKRTLPTSPKVAPLKLKLCASGKRANEKESVKSDPPPITTEKAATCPPIKLKLKLNGDWKDSCEDRRSHHRKRKHKRRKTSEPDNNNIGCNDLLQSAATATVCSWPSVSQQQSSVIGDGALQHPMMTLSGSPVHFSADDSDQSDASGEDQRRRQLQRLIADDAMYVDSDITAQQLVAKPVGAEIAEIQGLEVSDEGSGEEGEDAPPVVQCVPRINLKVPKSSNNTLSSNSSSKLLCQQRNNGGSCKSSSGGKIKGKGKSYDQTTAVAAKRKLMLESTTTNNNATKRCGTLSSSLFFPKSPKPEALTLRVRNALDDAPKPTVPAVAKPNVAAVVRNATVKVAPSCTNLEADDDSELEL